MIAKTAGEAAYLFYRKIKSLITYYNLKYSEIAFAIGISTTSLSNKLNGKGRWWYHEEVIPLVKYFNNLGEDLTSEELFELKLRRNYDE